jgi:hypothetical protein
MLVLETEHPDIMRHQLIPLCTCLLALSAGVGCETSLDVDKDVRDSCAAVAGSLYSCNNEAGPEGSTYFENCLKRSIKVSKADELCGKLWLVAYQCVADLPCEDFLQWARRHYLEPEVIYPCKAENDDFFAECPDQPLWTD